MCGLNLERIPSEINASSVHHDARGPEILTHQDVLFPSVGEDPEQDR
jgi:hypothetical protein